MKHRLLVVGVILAGLAVTASADTVTFKNGDRLTGVIETVLDGKLTLKTDASGTVVIDMAQVATFSTDAPIKLQLNDGSVVNQKINAADSGNIELAGNETIRSQPVSLASLTAVNPPEKPRPEWKGNVTAGYTQTTGNSETTTASLDVNVSRRGENDRITASGYYLYGKEKVNGEEKTSKDKWGLLGKYDYFITEEFYAFVNGSYERDRVANLDVRAIIGGGVGYQWIESADINFNTDAGIGFMHEAYSEPTRENNTVVGQLGYHFDWKIIENLLFLHDLRYYPDLGKLSNFKVITSAELRANITKSIFASAKAIMDYNSEPAEGKKRRDMTYILGVGINF